MVNQEERLVNNTLKSVGYTVLHVGAPDFLCFCGNPEKESVKNIVFIEIKSDKSPKPTKEQWNWILVLRQLGLNVLVINPNKQEDRKRLVKYARPCYYD